MGMLLRRYHKKKQPVKEAEVDVKEEQKTSIKKKTAKKKTTKKSGE